MEFHFQPVDAETARKLCLPPGKGLPLPTDVEQAMAAFPGSPLEFFVQCVEDYVEEHPEDHAYDPLLFRHAYVRAVAFANTGELDAAQLLFIRALRFAPGDVECLLNAGRCAIDRKDFAVARDWLRRARAGGEASAELYDALALAEIGCHDAEAAVREGEEAIGRFPDRWETLDTLTTVYFHAGRWKELESRLFDQLQQRPEHAKTLAKMGSYFRAAGRFEEAHRCLDRARTIAPDDIGLRVEVAMTLRDEGKIDDAETLWREVLVAHPDHPEALLQLAMHCLEHARPEEARELLDRAVGLEGAAVLECAAEAAPAAPAPRTQRTPRDFRPHYLLGKYHSMRGEPGRVEAITAFGRALDAVPEDTGVLTYIAVMGRELRDTSLAVRAEEALAEMQARTEGATKSKPPEGTR
ncbi:MAG: tetratricopeptide repeat protein [Planctomycetes bacterium]|nr:tetratricopeptide repeat protein [Planctomycetota bacterium]